MHQNDDKHAKELKSKEVCIAWIVNSLNWLAYLLIVMSILQEWTKLNDISKDKIVFI